MIPADFKEANITLKGSGEVLDIRLHDTGDNRMIGCWQLSKEDLELINRTGRIWFTSWTDRKRFYPISIYAENPFHMPRPIRVNEDMVNRTSIFLYDTMEIVVVVVEEDEVGFKVEHEEGSSIWLLSCRNKHTGEVRYDTPYFFGEEVKVFGMASDHYGNFNELVEKIGQPADRLLILERINKTEYE